MRLAYHVSSRAAMRKRSLLPNDRAHTRVVLLQGICQTGLFKSRSAIQSWYYPSQSITLCCSLCNAVQTFAFKLAQSDRA